ncbi:MAG: hypothetical protein UEL03_06900 [Clostridium sp.]|uniref:DUF7601 domain-containing protein n=1 Tax=Clostridium sp. TaxID=1506 RepID=UPI002E794E16|nr:hypothetical protein [Clostridium sp.]MEE0131094.1 hypothetical protein [Clostridium sp.]
MRRIRKKIKRTFAMILTVCMVLTSFQGIAFADPDLDSSAKERDVLFELDGTALKTEAEEAIRSGAFYNAQVGFQELLETSDEEDPIKFVDSDAYADIFDQSTGSIYQLQDIPYAHEASASDAMYEDAELQIFVKLNGQAAKAATQSNAKMASDSNITEESDSEMEKASDSDLRKPSVNDTIIDTENYEMNGDEKLVFLFINRSNDDLTFQLDIDGRKSALVQVESKNVLLATDQEEEETPAPSTDEEVNKGQENQGSTEENDGNGTTGNGTTENGSGSTSTEENENKDTTVEGGNQGSEENSGNTTENTAPSTDNKEENKGQENQGGNEGNKETIVEIENQGSKDNSGDTTENKAPSVANKGENKAQENQGGNEGNTGNSASEKGEEQQVSISSHRIDRVMAFVPQDSYDDDDEDAPKSPEEEFEMMGEDDEEEEEVDDETYNDDVDVYTSDVEGVDIPAEVYPVVLMKRKSRSLFRMVRARGNAKAAEASAGLMVMSVSALQPVAEGQTGVFVPKVDFYDYWDSPNDKFVNDDSKGFNAAIVNKVGKHNLAKTQTFSLYAEGSNDFLRTLENDKKAPWQTVNIAQNLVDTTYSDESRRAHIKKEFGPHTTMFPVDEAYIKNNYDVYNTDNTNAFKDGIRWYSNVEFPGFKSITENGCTKYVFDAQATSVRRDDSSKKNLKLKVINSRSNGFWPFNTVAEPENKKEPWEWWKEEQKKYSFGMHMSVPFYLPLNGCYGENGNVPLTFTFKGDDDVWVYLKEVDPTNNTFTSRLVLDLGGIHSSCTGTINFATGDASVSPDTDKIIKINDDGSYENVASVGGRAVNVKLKDLGIENGKFYSLEFFYMERNPTESNCYIEIGLPVTPAGTLQITKEVKGISLTDEKVNKDYEFEVLESDDHNKWNKLKNNITINPTNNKTKSITTTTTKWYRVKEIDPEDDSTASWTGSGILTDDGCYEVKVEPEKGATVVCTNKYSANSLQITKQMTGTSLPENLAANFKVTINNSNGKKIKISKPDSTDEFVTLSEDNNVINNIALKNNETCIISGLDANSTYKVEETGITDENYKYDAKIQSGGDGKDVEVNNGNKTVTGGFQEKEDGSSHVNFTFTNVVKRKNKVLTLTKKLSGFMELRPSTDQKYTFELLKRKGAKWKKFEDFTFADTPAKADKTIEITGAGSVKLNIDPEDAEGDFKFVETGEGKFNSDVTSWELSSNHGTTYQGKESPEFSFSDKTESELICTNTYNVNRTLTVEKKLTDNSANVTGTFEFNATFTGNNDAVLSIPYEIIRKGVSVSTESGTLTDSANDFNLAPGDKITFTKIPNGASYQITETGMNTVENSGWYDIKCTGAVVDDSGSKNTIPTNTTSSGNSTTIGGTFSGNDNKNQMVTFTNSVTVKTGKLKITKKIVESSTSTKEVKADDNLTFTFKVTKKPGGMNVGKSFYVSVPIAKGDSEGSKEITVPVGAYTIEEMSYLQYKAVENSKTAAVEAGSEPGNQATVIFHNYRCADGYFTDSKVTVNTVIKEDNKFRFHSEDTSKPKIKIRQIAALFTNSGKTEDDDDNEN